MTHYEKGANNERELRDLLEARGFVVMRSAGSRVNSFSPDLLALSKTKIIAFECKAWKNVPRFEKSAIEKMREWELRTNIPFYIAWKPLREEWKFFPYSVLKETEKGFALEKDSVNWGLSLEQIS